MFRVFALSLLFLMPVAVSAEEIQEIKINIKDHKFDPSEITIPANKKVKLIVKNNDSTAEEFESHELKREKVIAGGKEAKIFIGPLDKGEYPFFGDFNPKTAQGKIIVK